MKRLVSRFLSIVSRLLSMILRLLRAVVSRVVRVLLRLLLTQQSGLIAIIVLFGLCLTIFGGTRVDLNTGATINNFLNPRTIMLVITNACVFAIMAVGVTLVIITGGIDISVGSIYALAGIVIAVSLHALGDMSSGIALTVAITMGMGAGALCGLVNGSMVTGLGVHPFIITLGTQLIFRGIAFVISKADSILLPDNVIGFTKATMGLGSGIYPIPMLFMLVVTLIGELYLLKTVSGRNVYAVGGNQDAARYCGLRINRVLIGVYIVCGVSAGIAAFVGSSYYGSASCNDGQSYEMYAIAAAVVGGASLMGGKGSAFGAMLGAILIAMIRQSISTLGLKQNHEQIIVGVAIIAAVVIDRVSAKMSSKRLTRAAGANAGSMVESEDKLKV